MLGAMPGPSALAQPTPADHARAQAAFDRLQLSAGCYSSYRRAALAFIANSKARSQVIRIGNDAAPIVRPRMISSLLFKQSYLVCDVPRSWMAQTLPGCEGAAIQTPRWPPLVVLPTPRPNLTRVEMLSIVEHEFVHVHQMLLGRFQGSRPRSSTLEGMRREFFRSICDEYEANLLQLTRWPHLWRGIECPLDEWCVLRGYTSALEGLIEACVERQASMRAFCALFNDLPRRIAKGFADHRIHAVHAEWVKRLWPQHFRTAVELVIGSRIPSLFDRRVEALKRLAESYDGPARPQRSSARSSR